VSQRYERDRSCSNRGFSDRNQLFDYQAVAGKIADPLAHNATVLNIRGHSGRMRHYDVLQKIPTGGSGMVT